MFSSNTSQVSADANWIEECFSTHLYTGNGSTQTITNGIDLSTKGGLVWLKGRSGGDSNVLYDTNRGVTSQISSNSTDAAQNQFPFELTNFNANGFTIGSGNTVNRNGSTYASWTFRKQPKFFDVVTYTGNGVDGRAISHNLGAIPRFIIVKRTDASAEWRVYAYTPTGPQTFFLALNTTGADGQVTGGYVDNPTLTQFQTYAWSSDISTVNANGGTYVAYLFASNAGGFGLTGTDNVISCGSFTTDGSGNATVSLGYEPQYILWKRTDSTGNWLVLDNMRGWANGSTDSLLRPNLSDAESTGADYGFPTATGFYMTFMATSATYIYIAIRRGPMKTPTTGTSVFAPYVTSSLNNLYNAGFVTDWVLQRYAANTDGWYTGPRLTGGSTGGYYMKTESTAAEVFSSAGRWDSNTGAWNFNANYGLYMFRRAPGFFDVVCYTGTGGSMTLNHNLGVAPELLITKSRSGTSNWFVIYSISSTDGNFLYLNLTNAASFWGATGFTATQFFAALDSSSVNYVAYLFASCPGVSKVGSYTGTGALQTINCGFTGGARFVLIKRTDSTGDWFVYDSARGITSGNDPYLLMNSTAAEVTGTNYVDTTSVGFQVTAAAPAGLNANGGTYIFLAIA